jgi:FAD/FMN-containing dehydrogenase
MIPTLEEKLKAVFHGDIDSRNATRGLYSHDASLFEVVPKLVVYPRNTADIQNLVRFVSGEKENDATVSLTMRAAGTDMSGGPLNDSIIADMTKYFTHIGLINADSAIVEPGVYYRDFEKETLRRGLIMPSYTASKDICTVGGMVANNSGGEKSIKYGKVEQYVRRLTVVFSDGNAYTVVPLSKAELDRKMAQGDFEGNLYKQLFELIEANYDEIQAARPNVSKNSAGYYLWNVWDRNTGVFDLTKLIVGSQGTLGVVSEIEFGLVPVPKYSRMVVMYLRSIERLGDVVDQVMRYEPESFESYDDYSMKLAIKFAGDFFKTLGFFGAIRLGLQFIPDMLSVITGGVPKLILMAEVTGDDERAVIARTKEIKRAVKQFRFKTHVATSAAEAEKYWKIRRESFNLLRNHSKGKRTAPFIDDIIVDPHQLPAFLPRLQKILDRYKLIYTIAGHAGNGNFHIIPLMDLANPISGSVILDVSKQVYALVAEYKGSITAEHNDGIIRTPFLSYMYSSHIIELFGQVKHIFDPKQIFNPGKKVGGSFDYITAHLIKGHDTEHGS